MIDYIRDDLCIYISIIKYFESLKLIEKPRTQIEIIDRKATKKKKKNGRNDSMLLF